MKHPHPDATFTVANCETAMCLWEEFVELRLKGDPRVEAMAQEAGTPSARHTVMGWIPECEAAWTEAEARDEQQEPYDWEHCVAFLHRKLDELYA